MMKVSIQGLFHLHKVEGCFHHILIPWPSNIFFKKGLWTPSLLSWEHPGSQIIRSWGQLPGLLHSWANNPDLLTFLNILWEQISPPCHSQKTQIRICLLPCASPLKCSKRENFLQSSHLAIHNSQLHSLKKQGRKRHFRDWETAIEEYPEAIQQSLLLRRGNNQVPFDTFFIFSEQVTKLPLFSVFGCVFCYVPTSGT